MKTHEEITDRDLALKLLYESILKLTNVSSEVEEFSVMEKKALPLYGLKSTLNYIIRHAQRAIGAIDDLLNYLPPKNYQVQIGSEDPFEGEN